MLAEDDQRFDTSGFGEVLLALEELRAAIENLQIQPLIVTDPPDLSDIVNAVNGLKPGASADEIAQAIADKLRFPEPVDNTGSVVEAINALTDKLDWRFQSLGRSFGGGTTAKVTVDQLTIENVNSDVTDREAREVGRVTVRNLTDAGLATDATLQQVRDKDFATQATLATRASETTLATRASETTLSSLNSKDFATQATLATRSTEATLLDVKRGLTDYEARLDYDGSNNLIYSGKAPNATATSANSWTIQKLSYTGSNLTRVQVLTGAWDNRASLAW